MRLPVVAAVAALLPLAACGQDNRAAPEAVSDGEAAAVATPSATLAARTDTARAPLGATASAALKDAQGRDVGRAVLTQGPAGVLIRVEAAGLTPGWHGLHLHKVGQCDGPGFTSAGAHVTHGGVASEPHGLLNADGPDAGDLPNLYADAQGRAFAEVFTPFARLAETGPGEHLLDADGASILIHAGADDHSSQPIGGAGDRVACGVIAAG